MEEFYKQKYMKYKLKYLTLIGNGKKHGIDGDTVSSQSSSGQQPVRPQRRRLSKLVL